MCTTFNLDDDLLGEAQPLTGMTRRTALIHEGLRTLIQRGSARSRPSADPTPGTPLLIASLPAGSAHALDLIAVKGDHLRGGAARGGGWS